MSDVNDPNNQTGQPGPGPTQPHYGAPSAQPAASQPQYGQAAPQQAQPAQPQYGQVRQPEYGQMASQYPGWDPYVFGRPEPKDGDGASADASAQIGPGVADAASQAQAGATPRQGQPPLSQQQLGFNPYPYGGPQTGNAAPAGQGPASTGPAQAPANGNPYARRAPGAPGVPVGQPNLDDPAQNPFYGKWDLMAVAAMVCAWLLPPAGVLLALFSMRRTRMLHMRGRALAIAALVIAILGTIVDVLVSIYGIGWYVNWLSGVTGVDVSQMLESMGIDPGTVGGGSSPSVSA